jgi:hypothetical protein
MVKWDMKGNFFPISRDAANEQLPPVGVISILTGTIAEHPDMIGNLEGV